MNDTPDHEHDFVDDDEIEITDLSPHGLPEHRYAQRALALAFKGLATPWIRSSLSLLLLLLLLGVLLAQLYKPSALSSTPGTTATPQAEAPFSPGGALELTLQKVGMTHNACYFAGMAWSISPN